MKSVRVFAAVAALVVMAAMVSAQSKGSVAMNGTLKTEAGEPVADAVVNFLLPSGGVIQGKTDATGAWKVEGVGKGEWRVMFVAKGYVTNVMKVQVKEETGTAAPLAVVMKKSAA